MGAEVWNPRKGYELGEGTEEENHNYTFDALSAGLWRHLPARTCLQFLYWSSW